MPAQLEPIQDGNLQDVCRFLHLHLNSGISVDLWKRALSPRWSVGEPNRGYLLRDDAEVVGVHPLIRCERKIDGQTYRFGNLTSWCVLPRYRMVSLRLLEPILAEKNCHFTDFTPRPEVAQYLHRRGFKDLDRHYWVVPNLPFAGLAGGKIVEGWEHISTLLTGEAARVASDHFGATGVVPLAIVDGRRASLVLACLHKRLRLPAATIVHASDIDHLASSLGALGRHMFWRHRAAITLIERRMITPRPMIAFSWLDHRRLMYCGDLPPGRVDYLYSEIMLLPIF